MKWFVLFSTKKNNMEKRVGHDQKTNDQISNDWNFFDQMKGVKFQMIKNVIEDIWLNAFKRLGRVTVMGDP